MQKIKADNKYREKINVEGLETTSQDGTKVKHLFHSDSQVVSMRDERTLNEFANEVLDWEEKTTDATGKIVANNCKRAWLKNFEIQGQTAKNCLNQNLLSSTTPHTDNRYRIFNCVSTGRDFLVSKNQIELENNKEYDVYAFILENTMDVDIHAVNNHPFLLSKVIIPKGKTGVIKTAVTTIADMSQSTYGFWLNYQNSVGNKTLIASIIVVDKGSNITQHIPFGLSSTQAIISNNGMKSVFYASEEDKVNKKVIELSKVGDVADTLTLNDDGSGTLLYNTSTLNPNINDNITFYNETDVDLILAISKLSDWKASSTQNTLCNIGLYNREAWDKAKTTEEPISYCFDSGNRFFVRIKKTITSTLDTAKKYIIENLEIKYQLVVPITTHIPKELMQVVAVHQTNILSVDSPVQPSSFKATAPVDKVGILEKELARIAAIVDTPKNITLLDNYVEDEYNKNQKEEGVM